MTARPAWVRIVWRTVAVLAAGAALWMGWIWLQLTANVTAEGFMKPTPLDAQEAERKLRIYRDALTESNKGFVRLLEVEINSYIKHHLLEAASPESSRDLAGDPSVRLAGSRLRLSGGDMVWLCLVKKEWLGKKWNLVWQRELQPKATSQGWQFAVASMKVGRMEIPRFFWNYAQDQLGAVDQPFASELQWIREIPWFEVKTNAATGINEMRLFTYQPEEVLSAGHP